MKNNKWFVTLLLLASSSAFAQGGKDPYFANPNLPASLVQANENLLKGNMAALTGNLKDALMNAPNASTTKSVMSLYDRAYQAKGDHALTPDWKLPSEITWMSIGSRTTERKAQSTIRHMINISVEFKMGTEIEQLRIVKHPNNVIMDKQNKIGYFEKPSIEPEGTLNLWGQSDRGIGDNPSGLYHLEVQMKGQAKVQGWFILSHMNASTVPVLKTQVNRVFTTSQPTFEWEDFKSPEYRGFESRKVTGFVVKDDTEAYSFSARDKEIKASHQASKPIAAGDYNFRLSYRERHNFGGLTLSRESETIVPITIK